jgi:PAS domain-containing protein
MPRMTRTELAERAEVWRRRTRSLERRLRRRDQADGELRQSEARLRSLFEHAEDLIVACRLDGTITNVNRAIEQTLGWSRGELIGHSIARIVTPASVEHGQERVRRALAGEKLPKIFELEVVRPLVLLGHRAQPLPSARVASAPVRALSIGLPAGLGVPPGFRRTPASPFRVRF